VQAKNIAVLVMALAAASGCQSLTLHDDDSGAITGAKIVARTALGVSTMGLSEIYYARNRRLNSWLGAHINQAIAQWGPPSQVSEGYGGMRFFTWYRSSQYTTPGRAQTHCDGWGNCYTTATPARVNTIQSRVTFTVNESGTIVQWSAQ
jgi:hypothetical protein